MSDKHTFIEMYNSSNYDSWEQAWKFGAVYITTVFSVDEPREGVGFSIMEDMHDAIETACCMMDSNSEIKLRTRIGPVSDNNYIYAKNDMKTKTGELTGAALNYAVSLANGQQPKLYRINTGEPPIYVLRDRDGLTPAYSTDWTQGGPIIERESIRLMPEQGATYVDCVWLAGNANEDGDEFNGEGPTPLIAAMRCYVASKLGEEIELPEQLIPRD